MLLLRNLGVAGLRALLAKEQARHLTEGAGFGGIDYDANSLARLQRDGSMQCRKARVAARLLVDQQKHEMLLHAHVCKFYQQPEIRGHLLAHLNVMKNVQRQVTNRVAIAYNEPPRRELVGIADAQQSLFLNAYRDARADLKAEQINRYAFIARVVHVLPRFERGKLALVTVLPHVADVLFDPDGEEDPSILVYQSKSRGADFVAVDSERWWWCKKDGSYVEEEHGLGMVPWVAFRCDSAPEGDYWDAGAGQDLFDATMKLGRIQAHFAWVRSTNAKRLTHVHLGANDAMPENQNMNSSAPVQSRGDGDTRINVLDTIVPCEEFIVEMAETRASIYESYGLPSRADLSTDSSELHEALVKLRDGHIKHFDIAEVELAVRVAAVLRKNTAFAISDDDVRRTFRVSFARMSYNDHPKERMATAKAEIELGQTSVFELYQATHPGTSPAEAEERVMANVAARGRYNKLLIEHNVSADPTADGMTLAQVNGMLGGQQSGIARQSTDPEHDTESPS